MRREGGRRAAGQERGTGVDGHIADQKIVTESTHEVCQRFIREADSACRSFQVTNRKASEMSTLRERRWTLEMVVRYETNCK